MNTDRLYYLSQDLEGSTHLDQIRRAVDSGIQWIQLRSKIQSRPELLKTAGEAVEIVSASTSKLIINDCVDAALKSGAHGVHLGSQDMKVSEARAILGPDAIIGATANTFEEAISRSKEGADYLGVGPFRFTTTKTMLSPVLGLNGVRQIKKDLNAASVNVPVFIIGGITMDDVVEIMDTGAYGIAVSSAINLANDPDQAILGFQNIINRYVPSYQSIND